MSTLAKLCPKLYNLADMEYEQAQPKLRKGETSTRPYGGQVSDEPFPRELYQLVKSRGFESQLCLAKALGMSHNSVRAWFTGESAPTPEHMGRILILCQLCQPITDEELDKVIDPYAELIADGKGNNVPTKGSKRALAVGRTNMKSIDQPWNQWLENYSQENNVTLGYVAGKLNFLRSTLRQSSGISLESYYEILDRAPESLNLDSEHYQSLVEAVAQTIEQGIAKGCKYKNGIMLGGRVRSLQKELVCTTYNGNQTAQQLGVSRERVRQLRAELNLPHLLTEDQVQMLKDRKAAFLARRKS